LVTGSALWHESLSLLLLQNLLVMLAFRSSFARLAGRKFEDSLLVSQNSLIVEVLLPVEGDREACPFEGVGAAADPYRKDPLSLSLETSLL